MTSCDQNSETTKEAKWNWEMKNVFSFVTDDTAETFLGLLEGLKEKGIYFLPYEINSLLSK